VSVSQTQELVAAHKVVIEMKLIALSLLFVTCAYAQDAPDTRTPDQLAWGKRLVVRQTAVKAAWDVANADAALQRAEAAKQNADAAQQIASAAQVTAEVTAHNEVCHGDVPQSTYDWCLKVDAPKIQPDIASANAWGAKVNEWKRQVDVWAPKVDAANAQVMKDDAALRKEIDEYVAALKAAGTHAAQVAANGK
jgi:hypothetical protein